MFKVGDWFVCVYNGVGRVCEVIEIPAGRDYIVVRTKDGFRSFKLAKMEKIERA